MALMLRLKQHSTPWRHVAMTWLALVVALWLTVHDTSTNHYLLAARSKRPMACKGSHSAPSTYTIVIDAGSTGTRVHVYEFCGDGKVLVDELFREVKPGLSSFADAPKQAADSVWQLVRLARLRVPRKLHARTRLTVQATAGLRLLSPDKVAAIMGSVQSRLLRHSPFPVEGVSVIDGRDEGFLAWLAVRFLRKERSLGPVVLDLGGASTQIVFAHSNNQSNSDSQVSANGQMNNDGNNKVLDSSQLDGNFFTLASLHPHEESEGGPRNDTLVPVFRHSYLGLGLMEARRRVKEHFVASNANSGKHNVEGFECAPPGHVDRIHVNGTLYTLSNTAAAVKKASFWKCRQLVMRALGMQEGRVGVDGVPQPRIEPDRPIIAFSYFWDRSVGVGLSSPVTPRHYMALGERICQGQLSSLPTGQNDNNNGTGRRHEITPEWCLDVAYIHALLTAAYGLRSDHQITVVKQIDGWEAGWALGAGLQLLNK